MIPYTSFFCSIMSNPRFFELVNLLPFVCCFGISHCTVEGGLPFREVYFGRLQDERSQPVLRDPDSKKFSNPLYIHCFNCFTAKVVSVFVFLSAGDTCLYAPILATCQSPPVASPCNQTQSQKCRHSRNTKKRNT